MEESAPKEQAVDDLAKQIKAQIRTPPPLPPLALPPSALLPARNLQGAVARTLTQPSGPRRHRCGFVSYP